MKENMRRRLLALSWILVLTTSELTHSLPLPKSLRDQVTPNYLRAMAAYKRLERRLPGNDLHAVTTVGILNGARKVEEDMERNLINIMKDLLLNTDLDNEKLLMPKIEQIEQQLRRDRSAIQILNEAMDLAIGDKNIDEFRNEMLLLRQQIQRQDFEVTVEDNKAHVSRMSKLRHLIMQQIDLMRTMVNEKIAYTLEQLLADADGKGLLGQAAKKVVVKRAIAPRHNLMELEMINSLLSEEDSRQNMIGDEFEIVKAAELVDLDLHLNKLLTKRMVSVESNAASVAASTERATTTMTPISSTISNVNSTMEKPKPARQEEDFPEIDVPMMGDGGGGGLVGIISSLSGGEGGSDVGALIGALTGVIGTLFGPGGLDIESLLGTATALISGLLSGNQNFGTVLGQYVGTALEGFTGGGGAINNGQFIGNFLGTVVASLSADPEEDDGPLRPLVFVQNVLSSFIEAKNRRPTEDLSQERQDYQYTAEESSGKSGSDSSAFIKHIVSHIVGGAVSLILNASLGASGGASQASSGLFQSSSSSHSKPADGGGAKSW